MEHMSSPVRFRNNKGKSVMKNTFRCECLYKEFTTPILVRKESNFKYTQSFIYLHYGVFLCY